MLYSIPSSCFLSSSSSGVSQVHLAAVLRAVKNLASQIASIVFWIAVSSLSIKCNDSNSNCNRLKGPRLDDQVWLYSTPSYLSH